MYPKGWRRLPFSAAVEINPRRTVARGTLAPFVDMAALPAETRKVRPCRVKPVGSGAPRFANGDTLFARITPCTENGKTGLVDFLPGEEVAAGSTEFIVLGPRPEITLPEFVYYLAKNPAFRSFAISRMRGTSGRQRVPTSVFDDFEVRLPPLPEQRKIAAILSSVDDAIETTQAVVDQAQIVKRGLMQTLLTRGLPEWHTRFKQTETGEIPEDWATAPGIDLFRLSGGYAPKQMVFNDEGECLFVKVDSFNHRMNGTLIRHTAERFNEISNPNIKTAASRSLVFPKRGAAISKNRVRLLGTKATVDPNLMILTPTAAYVPSFLMYLLIHIGLFNLSDNSTIPQLNNKHLYPLLFPVPPIDEQEGIAESILAVDNRIASEEEQMIGLIQLKQALMSVLLTGEVRVTTDTEAA